MGEEYALWKWREPATISRGLCYLLVSAGAELPEVEAIDAERIGALLEQAFPALVDSRAEPPCVWQVHPTGILVEFFDSTPASVVAWFRELAAREGLALFDPQREKVTATDFAACEDRLAHARAADDAARWRDEIAGLTVAAARREPRAMVELGNRFSFGEGVERDPQRAVGLYRRAAELGHGDGMFNLAGCYRYGDGVERDLETAIAWYERALADDPLFAAFALGEIYASESQPVDRERAVHYLKIARAHGHQDAPRELRKLGALPPLPADLTRSRE